VRVSVIFSHNYGIKEIKGSRNYEIKTQRDKEIKKRIGMGKQTTR
jgi:hypothetical protein